MTVGTRAPRPGTAVDQLANSFVDRSLELSPTLATALGAAVGQDTLDDLSPSGFAALADVRRMTLNHLATLESADGVDLITVDAMRERLELEEELYLAGLSEMTLNVIASPLQLIRETFDLMPSRTPEELHTIARRLARVPEALHGWQDTLRVSAERHRVAPGRQVAGGAAQAGGFAAVGGFFDWLPTRLLTGRADVPQTVQDALVAGAAQARQAYGQLATFLTEGLLPLAPEQDACGIESYRLHSRWFLGTEVNLAEAYQWGRQELATISLQMQELADRIRPGATVAQAVAALDSDPRYTLADTSALQEWMQRVADDAVDRLAGTHFDIPEPLRRVECLIAPTHSGGIYYTPPSDDFTRPGRMWWAVPRQVTRFSSWRETSTVYHEGVPGHHLQLGQAAYLSPTLNSWRRRMCWTSGHAEGWALYAERLMGELGFLDDPGNRMGMLAGQSLRAARVVVDIGFHCGFEAPPEVGGGDWTYEKAWALLRAHSVMDDAFLRFELDRYLGWPGQAPSYKLGERIWLQLRAEAKQREGTAFNVRSFHRRALNLGGLGLDTLRRALLPTESGPGESSGRMTECTSPSPLSPSSQPQPG